MRFECNQAVFDSLESLCEFAYNQGYHELGYNPVQVVIDRIRELESAIEKAKAIDPYAGAGARGAGLLGSDEMSKYAFAYRDAVHDALDSQSAKD
jgi:hypothetical protein